MGTHTVGGGRTALDGYQTAAQFSGGRSWKPVRNNSVNCVTYIFSCSEVHVLHLPGAGHLAKSRVNQPLYAVSFQREVPNDQSSVLLMRQIEFSVEKPASPKVQAATWSNYKNKYTLKLLVGVTPIGCISFLSSL